MAEELVPSVSSDIGTPSQESGLQSDSPSSQQSPSLGSGSGHGLSSPEPPPEVTSFGDDQLRGVFGEGFRGMQDHLRLLMKQKTVYQSANKSSQALGTILDHRAVTVLQEPSRAGKASRSWAKVKANTPSGMVEGWVNTENGIEDHALAFQGKGEAIMDKAGPSPSDVKQGMIGDCYLLASLMAIARSKPDFIQTKLFRTDPTEAATQHTLEFHEDKSGTGQGPFKAQRVQVQNTVLATTTQVRTSDNSLKEAGESVTSHGDWAWPAIVEKAFFAWPGRNSLDTVSGGQSSRSSGMLTGEEHESIGIQPTQKDLRENSNAVADAVASAKEGILAALAEDGSGALTASTMAGPPDSWKNEPKGGVGGAGEGKVGGIAFGHVYSIVRADDSTVTVRNPWGKYGRVNGVVDERAAESVLSWEEFQQVFGGWSRKKARQTTPSSTGPSSDSPPSSN
ncbi:MAG: hypothetical protein JNM72_17520 [Deltaproteobacteria bacterium]|nr:hypothetical protein [Deltaproteobacteria bacterium]